MAIQQDELKLEDAVALLAQTPACLRALLADLPERWVRITEDEEAWSPYDVVGHLIHGERTNWLPRARHILAGERRPFPPFDRTAQFADSQGKSIGELLTTFAELRRENLATLAGMELTNADLSRTGQHPDFGEVSLGQLLATWAVHDLNHLGQIVQTMAKGVGNTVGPWRAYLAILDA
jgi:hypothetical protein